MGRKKSWEKGTLSLREDKTARVKMFEKLCQHVRSGYSLDCFSALSIVKVRELMKDFPEDFDENKLEMAMRDAKMFWENIGKQQAQGLCLGNSRSWYYNMANRYGWSDRQRIEAEHKGAVSVNVVSYASQKAPDVPVKEIAP